MDKKVGLFAALSIFLPLMLGLSMPSCPGQDELQSKLEASQQETTQLKARLQMMTQEVTLLKEDYIKTKKLVEEIGTTVLTQKSVIEQLDANVKLIAGELDTLKKKGPMAKKKR